MAQRVTQEQRNATRTWAIDQRNTGGFRNMNRENEVSGVLQKRPPPMMEAAEIARRRKFEEDRFMAQLIGSRTR